jgi:two-component system phosphate regulon response regulator PhoB
MIFMEREKILLLVEDDAAIRGLLVLHFQRAGFRVVEAEDVRGALRILDQIVPDVAVIDWMLPDVAGITLVERLRHSDRTRLLPIVLLTARAGEADKIRGLEGGADDYVTKPFSPRELLARVRALLRRAQSEPEGGPVSYGRLELIPDRRVVQVDGRSQTLGPTEFRLLYFLATHPERVWDRATLLDRVWGNDAAIEERTVDVHVRRLRLALRPLNAHEMVETVRGVGYRLTTEPDAAQ